MLTKAFIDNAKVMAKGQITIPKDVRNVLGVEKEIGFFYVEGNTIRFFPSLFMCCCL